MPYNEVTQKGGYPAIVKWAEVECVYKYKNYTEICFKSGCSLTVEDPYEEIKKQFTKWLWKELEKDNEK